MTAYAAVLSARFRLLLQYRGAAIAGMGTQLFWGLIRTMIFTAFYYSTTAPQPMSREQVVSYLWLGQAMFALLPWNVDPDVRAMIHTGSVAYEMLRPVDLYGLWYSRAVAQRSAPTLLRSVPLLLVAGLFFGLQLPVTWAAAAGWLLMTLAAVALAAAFATLMTVSLLWTVAGDGIQRILPTVVMALSGLLLPISLFPAWWQPALRFLPFADLMDTPFRVYLGLAPAAAAPLLLAHQLAWAAALMLAGRWALSRGLRRLVVQGG